MPPPPTPPTSTNGPTPSRLPFPVRAGLRVVTALAPRLAARGLAELCMRPPRHRAPAQERTAIRGAEPFAVRTGTGTIRGYQRGQGPAVLLLHGWGGGSGQLAALAQAVAQAGCTAFAMDAPGHGRSSGRVASVPLYAAAVAAVAGATRARAAIGHSFGGAALAFAATHGLELDAAVLIGAPASPALFVDEFCEALGLGHRARAALRARLEARVGHRFEELDLVRAVASVRTPALVVHDRGDREVGFDSGEALARAWPGARLHATAGLGHRRILRDPAVLAEAAAFVAGRMLRCA
jgi:pimeloyl-ACP methyl ester carboxylesterase